MTELLIKGKVKQILTRKTEKSFYYIYQFETINNDDYLEIIDVFSKDKLPKIEIDSIVELPITLKLRNDSLVIELKTNNLIKDS